MSKKESNNNVEAFRPRGGIIFITLLAIAGLYLIYDFISTGEPLSAMIFAAIPVGIVIFVAMIRYYHRIFYILFLSHFLFLLISSLIDLRIGVATLVFNLVITLFIIIASVYKSTSWKDSLNGMLTLFIVWGGFCVLQLANPNTVLEAWNAAISNYLVYPIICAILVPLCIREYRNVEWLLIIWSVFIIYGAFKGYWQKSHGFNEREMVFLYEKGGAETHIIWSGIRYFSFFTDAANFGVHSAMASLGFGLSAYFARTKWLKVYFTIIAALAVYGMFLSGTRAALAVPVGGLMAFAIISRGWKTLFAGIFALLVIFVFFRFTTIGESNQQIRNMRTAFRPDEDASYQVRVQNRELVKEYMASKPFGYGLGLGGKASRYNPKELMPIPPDSWLINVWTDTGIFGISLYVLIHAILFVWCSWILMFKISNKRLRNQLSAWLCVSAGFFIAAYANDVMQYPNAILVYIGFAICFAAPNIEKEESGKVPLPDSANNKKN